MVPFGGAPDTDGFRHRTRLYQGDQASPDKSLRTRRRPTMDGSPFLPSVLPVRSVSIPWTTNACLLAGSHLCGPRGKGSVLALDSARVYRDFWIPASYKPGPRIAATPSSAKRRSPRLMHDHNAYLESRMRQPLVEIKVGLR